MSEIDQKKKNILIIFFIIVVLITSSVYIYYRIEQDKFYQVNITVTPSSLVMEQGNKLPFYINASSTAAPFHVDASTYLNGLRLDYIGSSESNSPSATQPFAIIKFNLSNSSPSITAYWNSTVAVLTNKGPEYYLAPAGYYLIEGLVETSIGTPSHVLLNFSLLHTVIFVSGINVFDVLNLKNNSLGLTLNSTIANSGSASYPTSIVSKYNDTVSSINVSLEIQSYTYVNFRFIINSPQNSITILIKLNDGVLYQNIVGYGGMIA
ncbi:MAG: hypothetical protein M1460_05340 [Candidatus Thermoplasmatota archaeon]|jgi:hypothetical protein|nr:hypothetical protein [Candidatus Thermoplasmatota archaeon]